MLVEACIQHMFANIKVENAAKVFYLADLHHSEDLKREAGRFFRKHHQQVEQTDDWKQLIKKNPVLLKQMAEFVRK